jgi:predicted GTPase
LGELEFHYHFKHLIYVYITLQPFLPIPILNEHLSTEMSASHSGENIEMNYIIKQSRKSPKSYFIHVLHPQSSFRYRRFLSRLLLFAKKHFEKCGIVNEFLRSFI